MIVAAAGPARATFPGKNGRIAFSRFDPATEVTLFYTSNPDGTQVAMQTAGLYLPMPHKLEIN